MDENDFRALKERVEQLEKRADDDVAISLMLYHVMETLLDYVVEDQDDPAGIIEELRDRSLDDLDGAYDQALQRQYSERGHRMYQEVILHEQSLWRAVRQRLELEP